MEQLQQQLQQLSALREGAGSGLLKSILLLWLVWPVLCGLIGAGRCKALSGFMQGLFWGPFGLIPVLFSAKKYPCPTCGCQTLKHPMSDRSYEPTVARTITRPGVDMPPIPLEPSAFNVDLGASAATNPPLEAPRPAGRFKIPTPEELEAQVLHQWVNNEKTASR